MRPLWCRRGAGLRGLNPLIGAGASGRPLLVLVAPPATYRLHAYLGAAHALGVQALVVSQGEHSLVPEIAGGLQVDLGDTLAAARRVLAAVAGRRVGAVIATDDGATEVASHVARALGVRHNPPAAVSVARRKDRTREAFARAGLPGPCFRRVALNEPFPAQLRGVAYPCVVKPLAMAASRGVIRADGERELLAALERVRPILAEAALAEERDTALVEDFLPGFEVAVEGMLRDGHFRPLALFDKPEPLDGPFFEESYYVTPSRLPQAAQACVRERVAQACAAIGLVEGPVHAELRVHGGEAWPLEVAARTIGGDCARLLRFGTGLGLEELVLRHALDEPWDGMPAPGAAGVLMIPTPARGVLRRVEGVLAASRVVGVEEVSIALREGYELVPLPEGGSYLGFVFARAGTPAAVETALRAAHARLRVVVAPAWRLEAV